MGTCLQIGLTNALWAAVLAIFVAGITRIWRNPHLAHALWLIVLLRLVAPPVFQVPLQTPAWLTRAIDGAPPSASSDAVPATRVAQPDLERTDPKSAPSRVVKTGDNARPNSVFAAKTLEPFDSPLKSTSSSQATTAKPSNVPSPETPTPIARSLSPLDIGGGLWILGTALYLVVTIVRARRFGRAIRRFRSPAPDWLADEIAELSRMVGLRRSPRLGVVEAALPPMVWSGWRPTLLVPKTIVDSLDPAQRRLLLLHELWHVRRGDHRTRWFAVAVLALYWWHPVAWWAVRRLQNAEEECCDAAVLSLHPQPETYGEALLAVSEFVSCGSLPAAAVSIGVERKSHLQRRMTMILKGSRWPKLTKVPLAAVLAAAVIVITVSLTFAASQAEPPAETNSRAQAPSSTSQVTSGRPSEAAVHPATLTQNSQLDPKRPQGVETKPPAEQLPAWMTAQPVGGAGDDELHKLLNERYNAALKSLHAHVARIEVDPNIPATPVVAAARSLLDAELAITAAADTAGVYPRYVEFLRYFDDRIGKRWAAKTVGADEFNAVHEARLDAEIKLRQHPARPAPPAWLTAKALEPAPGDDELRKLQKERYNSALKALHAHLARIENESNVRITPVLAAARTLRDDEDAVAAPGDSPGAYQHYAEFIGYFDDFIGRHLGTKTIAADEINALVDAHRNAEQMRRRFSAQKSPARSTPSTTERTESLQSSPERSKSKIPGQAPAVPPSPAVRVSPATAIAADTGDHLPAWLTAKPLEAAAGDDQLQKLLKARYNSALKSLQGHLEKTRIDFAPLTSVIPPAHTLLDAELAVTAPKDKEAVYARYLEFMSFLDDAAGRIAKTRGLGFDQVNAVREARLDAEIKWMRAKDEFHASAERSKSRIRALEANMRIANAEFHAAQAGVGQTEADLRRAQANFTFHNRNLERLQKVNLGAIAPQTLDEARRDRDVDEANIDGAKAAFVAAQAQVDIKRAQLEKAEAEFAEGKASLEK